MKRFRSFWFWTAGISFLWLIYFGAGASLSHKLTMRFGSLVMKATRGNVIDPAIFIQNRIFESLSLATLALLAVGVHVMMTKLILRNSASATRHWTTHAISAFVLFNLWLGFAMQTTAFWCVMWQGEATQNLTRFHLKRLMFAENHSPTKAVILGNSQSRAQLDEELLNKLLQPQLHTAELHFPGSNAYDVWLEHRKIQNTKPNLVIVYVSEATFYDGNHHDAAANFFQFSDLKDLASADVRAFVPSKGFGYGLLGAALPIFRLRDVLAQRLLGTSITQLKQREYDQHILENLEATATKAAKGYFIDARSEFELRAFTEFVSDCEAAKEDLVILAGQLNPILGKKFDPGIRKHMLAFLHGLREKHSNVVLIENLPDQSPSDYDDLTHVKKEFQAHFTESMAEVLKRPISDLRIDAASQTTIRPLL
jgi:hypothetical protein